MNPENKFYDEARAMEDLRLRDSDPNTAMALLMGIALLAIGFLAGVCAAIFCE